MTFWIFPYFRKLNTAITNWVQDRHNTNTSAKKVALYLRPFLFWLDKTLNGLLTDGFAHAEETSPEEEVVDLRIPESFDTSVFANFPSNNLAAKSEPNIESSATSSSGKEKEKKNENGDAKVETDKKVEEEQGVNTADVHQQEFSLEGVELRGQAGTCLFTRLPIYCICSRCKYSFDWVFRLPPQSAPSKSEDGCEDGSEHLSARSFSSLPPHTTVCQRCKQPLGLTFTAEFLHAFASRVGVFQLANCLLFDVQIRSAEVLISCLNCLNGETKISVSGVGGVKEHFFFSFWVHFKNLCYFASLGITSRSSKCQAVPSMPFSVRHLFHRSERLKAASSFS